MRAWGRSIGAFFIKCANDWITGFSTLLAFNFLTAIFPLFLGVLALGAVVLPGAQIQQLADILSRTLPVEVTNTSGLNLNLYSMLTAFHQASRLTAAVSFGGFVWTGSNLFSAMENCFSIIFRTRGRDPVHQKLMAVGMVFLFAALAPLAVLAATVSGVVPDLAAALGHMPGQATLLSLAGYAVGVGAAFLLFFLIYIVVPNRRMHPGEVWRGALLAAALFEVVNAAFPAYVGDFMTHAWFGRLLLVFGVLAFWFWVVSLIFLVGAELNSFVALGQRALPADVAGLLQLEARRMATLPAMAAVDGEQADHARTRAKAGTDRSSGAPVGSTPSRAGTPASSRAVLPRGRRR